MNFKNLPIGCLICETDTVFKTSVVGIILGFDDKEHLNMVWWSDTKINEKTDLTNNIFCSYKVISYPKSERK